MVEQILSNLEDNSLKTILRRDDNHHVVMHDLTRLNEVEHIFISNSSGNLACESSGNTPAAKRDPSSSTSPTDVLFSKLGSALKKGVASYNQERPHG